MARRQQPELIGTEEPRTLRVGLLQTAPTFGATADNIASVVELRKALPEVDLALTPELSLSGYGFATDEAWEQLDSDDTRVRDLALQGTGVGFAEKSSSGLPWNSYLLGDRTTGALQLQHKLHPVSYAPWNEHHTFQPGSELGAGTVKGLRTSIAICNDMWHPVVPWLAARSGAEVLVVPVASMEGAEASTVQRTWEVILQHAATLLQCYVVFVNRCGTDSGATFWGGSRILGPDGSTLVRLGDEPATATVDLDLAAVRELRADVPLLAEARSDFVIKTLRGEISVGDRDV
jgi:predicted amidohydrolase